MTSAPGTSRALPTALYLGATDVYTLSGEHLADTCTCPTASKETHT
jgi:hypothetical protein